MKQQAMLGSATQDRQHSDQIIFPGGGNDKPLQYSCLENFTNSVKRQKDTITEDEPPRSEHVQYATGKE